jgi:hypothetical protein
MNEGMDKPELPASHTGGIEKPELPAETAETARVNELPVSTDAQGIGELHSDSALGKALKLPA